jgi:hypothetical protein
VRSARARGNAGAAGRAAASRHSTAAASSAPPPDPLLLLPVQLRGLQQPISCPQLQVQQALQVLPARAAVGAARGAVPAPQARAGGLRAGRQPAAGCRPCIQQQQQRQAAAARSSAPTAARCPCGRPAGARATRPPAGPHLSSSRQLASCASTAGWPTTTIRALARVMATLKRLGLCQNPSCASAAAPAAPAPAPGPAAAPAAGGSDSGLDKTVDMKMMRASWPCSTQGQRGTQGWGAGGGAEMWAGGRAAGGAMRAHFRPPQPRWSGASMAATAGGAAAPGWTR